MQFSSAAGVAATAAVAPLSAMDSTSAETMVVLRIRFMFFLLSRFNDVLLSI